MPGHYIDAPPARRRKPERTTERLELTLKPADAAAIRIAAELLKMTHSAYVTRLVATAGDPMQLARESDHLADASRIAAAVSQVPAEVRRMRSELGRQGGLLKSFFVREDADSILADKLALECAETLRQVSEAAYKTEAALADLNEKLSSIRSDLERAISQLTGR